MPVEIQRSWREVLDAVAPGSSEQPLYLWDRSKLLGWMLAARAAHEIRRNPGRAFAMLKANVERYREDGHTLVVRVWSEFLQMSPVALSERILDLDDDGELARDTLPPAIAPLLQPDERTQLMRLAKEWVDRGLVVFGTSRHSPVRKVRPGIRLRADLEDARKERFLARGGAHERPR